MTYKVFLHPKAADFLEKCDSQLRLRIKNRLRELEDSPKEKGERLRPSRFSRLRIGSYQAIYMINEDDKKVVILFIFSRKKTLPERAGMNCEYFHSPLKLKFREPF